VDYKEAMDYLHGTYKFGSRLGLQRIQTLLEFLGNPHKDLKYVHIAGTNGKGSIASFVFNILKEAGYNTGLFTSPYIQRFSERIKINDTEIENESIARILTIIKEKISQMQNEGHEHPTEFEILTAMAFIYYKENNCDIVVLEVGIGGDIDSTNVIEKSQVSVITTISYDHMDLLGNTLEEIATRKSGIIKQNGKVVVYPQCEEVIEVIEKVCSNKNATLHKVSAESIVENHSGLDGQIFDFESLKNIKISMLGKHQILNAAVAIKAINVLADNGFKITDEAIKTGLLKAKWPGRLEIVNREPLFILDGAHNIQGTDNLIKNLKNLLQNKKFIFIVGVLKDKEYEAMLLKFIPFASKFFTVTPQNTPRGMKSEDLAEFIKIYHENVQAFDSVGDAINEAINTISSDEVICAFGSLYYIGEVRDHFGLS